MINYISGTVRAIHENRAIVSVGPVGVALCISQNHALIVGNEVKFHTYLHWNQEQGPSLYGFLNELERTVFLLVIGCSGLGPKIALAVLSDLGPHAFLDAIATSDDRALSTVSGIGQKKAEQIIVQLRHKVSALIKSGVVLENTGSKQWGKISQVLTSLNYSQSEISYAMKQLNEKYSGSDVPFDQLMRQALSFLTKKT